MECDEVGYFIKVANCITFWVSVYSPKKKLLPDTCPLLAAVPSKWETIMALLAYPSNVYIDLKLSSHENVSDYQQRSQYSNDNILMHTSILENKQQKQLAAASPWFLTLLNSLKFTIKTLCNQPTVSIYNIIATVSNLLNIFKINLTSGMTKWHKKPPSYNIEQIIIWRRHSPRVRVQLLNTGSKVGKN